MKNSNSELTTVIFCHFVAYMMAMFGGIFMGKTLICSGELFFNYRPQYSDPIGFFLLSFVLIYYLTYNSLSKKWM